MPTKVINKPKITRSKTGVRLSNGKRPGVARSQNKPSAFEHFLRGNLHWIFLGAGAIFLGLLLFVGYQKVIASSIFEVKRIDIAGGSHTDNKKVEETVRNFSAKTGVWNTDLTAIQRGVEQLPWVKTATVSRVLPDGLRVRLTEREPKAMVRLASSGALVWVDDEARILAEVNRNENQMFVLTGWNEARDQDAAKKNQERVRLYLRLLDEFRRAEIVQRVTAIDLSDLQDAEVSVNQNSQIKPVKIGNQDFAERLKAALAQLEILANADKLGNVGKIIVYDKTPVISPDSVSPPSNVKVNLKKAAKTIR